MIASIHHYLLTKGLDLEINTSILELSNNYHMNVIYHKHCLSFGIQNRCKCIGKVNIVTVGNIYLQLLWTLGIL